MSTNYYKLIETLILMKREFNRVHKPKYHELIDLLNEYEVHPYKDNENIPNNKQIATLLNCSSAKTNDLLKGLLKELLADINSNPLEIKDFVHKIHIHIPYEEQNKILHLNKKANKELIREYTWLEVKLPITPKIGEEIELDFLQDAWYNRGYVHRIQHTITGSRQEIYIEVHPLHDEYYRWQKMKENYEYKEKSKYY